MLDRLLSGGGLSVAFQPIVNLLSGDPLGYEVLGRAAATGGREAPGPTELLDLAAREQRLLDLDHAWRRHAIETVARVAPASSLLFFLNVDTRIIDDPRFVPGFTRGLLDRHRLPPSRFVLELTERDATLDGRRLAQLLPQYAQQGFRIALDDLGCGYASLNALLRLRPHVVKLDGGLIHGLHADPLRQNLVRALAEFARRSGVQLIAEHIETWEDLATLVRCEVMLGQGFLLGRPAPLPIAPGEDLRMAMRETARAIQSTRFRSARTVPIGTIIVDHPVVAPAGSCEALEERFRANAHHVGFPVVDGDERVVGLVMRDRFRQHVGGRFGWALHAKSPVSQAMERHPLLVDAATPIDQVSRLVTARPDIAAYDLVLVEREQRYLGVVTVRALLEATTELEVEHAKYASPLTGLPGNVAIEHRIQEVLEPAAGRRAWFVYADLDNFKAYNDVYGFAAGDEVIRLLAAVLGERFGQEASADGFIGHIGGDDFVVVAGESAGSIEEICDAVAKTFDERVRGHYAPDDLARGGVVALDRRRIETRFPVITLSMAIVDSETLVTRDVREVGRVAAELKRYAKASNAERRRSGWVRERRRPSEHPPGADAAAARRAAG